MTFIYSNFTTINVALNFGEKKKKKENLCQKFNSNRSKENK